jgi:hypothetical protein
LRGARGEPRRANDDIRRRTTIARLVHHLDACRQEPDPPFLEPVQDNCTIETVRKNEPRIDTMKAHRSSPS